MFKKLLRGITFLTLSLILAISTFLSTSCSIFGKDEIDRLLNFRRINYEDTDNIEIARIMQNEVGILKQKYLTNIQNDWIKKYNEFYAQLINEEKIDQDVNLKKPINVKSTLIDAVYFAQQPFAHYYPKVTKLGEVNSYEIPNWAALEQNGFNLYVNYEESIKIDFLNLDKNDYIDNNEEIRFYRLINNGTDNIFFKGTDKILKTDYGKEIKLSFIANNPLTGETLITKPNFWGNTKLAIQIADYNPENNKSFLIYKLGLWLNYEYAKNINLLSWTLTSFILAYTEIIGNYMTLLLEIKDKPENLEPVNLLKGFSSLRNGEYSGDTSSDLLYYAYKFQSAFSMFTIMMEDSETTVSLTIDQNMPLNVPVEENLADTTNNLSNREKLDFNPILQFDNRINDFISEVWNLLLTLDSKQCERIKENDITSEKCM
ncbi:hypothetical protein [Spiroplasma culicicola]|uniref:Lipoprotein n=1 Tax=Spiroplasma culicicola AES-1 TaxID=1276246 RepID=W6A8H9_9MOLU|nr:hypothetical protein [Spiroplasma culicicola]AHI53317.1 hypothetical protein SCULI_v1c09770 [Spiroplasma culicicola AES-1]